MLLSRRGYPIKREYTSTDSTEDCKENSKKNSGLLQNQDAYHEMDESGSTTMSNKCPVFLSLSRLCSKFSPNALKSYCSYQLTHK